MRYRAVFRPEAAAEASRRGSGTSRAERVSANPLAFPQVHGETRRAVLNRFPYAMYFRIDGDQVVVLEHSGNNDGHGSRPAARCARHDDR